MLRRLRNKPLRVLACLSLLALASPPARAVVTDNESVNFDGFTAFVPCAAGGAGELVVFTGDLHVLIAATFDGAGGVHARSHFQPQGLSGYGLTTGAKYQATGVTQDEFNLKVGIEETMVNNFRMIGQGPGNNFLVHGTFHITVNPNGTVTSFMDRLSTECK